jgi:hypothetical protein
MDPLTSGAPSRRTVVSAVGGVAAAALWYPTPAAAAPARTSPSTRFSAAARPAPGAQVVRGGARQYARPRIAPGHRLVLPAGTTVLRAGSAHLPAPGPASASPWPYAVIGGRTVDLAQMAAPGSPTAAAVLAGFGGRGWYEIRDQEDVLVDRREWDGGRLPQLRLSQEWGASTAHPYWGAFYTVRLEPVALPADVRAGLPA